LHIGNAGFVVFLNSHIQQFTTISHADIKVINGFYDVFEAGTLAPKGLCTLRVFPDIGFAEF
jgi:hypothetical protein